MKIREGKEYIIRGFTQPQEVLSTNESEKVAFIEIEGKVFKIPFKDILREHVTNMIVDILTILIRFIKNKFKK